MWTYALGILKEKLLKSVAVNKQAIGKIVKNQCCEKSYYAGAGRTTH